MDRDGKYISFSGEQGNFTQECSIGSEKFHVSFKFNYTSIPFNPIFTLKKTQEVVSWGLIDLFAIEPAHSYVWGLIFLDINSLIQDFKAKRDH